jgi:hypothetical protein
MSDWSNGTLALAGTASAWRSDARAMVRRHYPGRFTGVAEAAKLILLWLAFRAALAWPGHLISS